MDLHVHVGGRERTLDDAALLEALRARELVTTSRPNPAEFVELYRKLLTVHARIISIHLSGEISGTVQAARLAAAEINSRANEELVRVVDSRSTGMGMGFGVLAAAAHADDADADELVALVEEACHAAQAFFCVPSLEYLRRGGRIGFASAIVGTALSVKPILHIEDGKLVPLEKVRTMARARQRLVEIAVSAAGDRRVDIGVHHLGEPGRAQEMATRLAQKLPNHRRVMVTSVGAVLGAHTGPGLLGVVISPVQESCPQMEN
jgi:DegV family protein with EDD domain